jgi:hypothetical protein
MSWKNKLITLDLPPDEAHALAQLVKRLDRSDCERLSHRHDDGQERDAMIAGIDKLQRPSPKRASRHDDIQGAIFPRPRHHPMPALPQKALGCADGRPFRLRNRMHEVRSTMDGELTFPGRPFPHGPAFFPISRPN